MNGIIRTREEVAKVEDVSSIQIEEGFDWLNLSIRFFDAYGNSKDIKLASFIAFEFEKPEEVMVALNEKGSLPHNVWLQNSRYISFLHSDWSMSICYGDEDDAKFYDISDTNKIREIVFEDEDLPEYDYELLIHYINGETDEYYKRIAGKRWDSEARTKEEALEEMKSIDPDTFDEMAKCENVDYYEVAEVKYKVIGNEVVENMDDETVTFDTYAEAFDQIKEWKKLDKHEGWDDEYRIIEVIA